MRVAVEAAGFATRISVIVENLRERFQGKEDE